MKMPTSGSNKYFFLILPFFTAYLSFGYTVYVYFSSYFSSVTKCFRLVLEMLTKFSRHSWKGSVEHQMKTDKGLKSSSSLSAIEF